MKTIRLPRTVIALFCTTLQVCLGTVYAWSFFQTILVRQSGWTFTQSAWAFSITIFTLGVSAAWAGQALPRQGPRRLALLGSALFSVGYLIGGLALYLDWIPLFYLGYGVIGGAGIGMGYVTPVATVAKWFPDRKGLVTGIVVMGFGVGAFLLSKGLAPLLVLQAGQDLSLVFVWLGVIFACVLIPCSFFLSNPPETEPAPGTPSAPQASAAGGTESVWPYIRSPAFVILWIVFFFNIAAGISVISFQSELLQEVWGLSDPSLEPAILAEYGATLIAVSSLCNGVGRLFWGLLSDRIGRVAVFRILLASQMVVFGILMTETNPIVFSALVCYVLLCFGGGFATMPSFVLDVFGPKKMSTIYGAILTAWAAAGIAGPVYVGYLKDVYPDRAVLYCFLIGVMMLGAGFVFSYLLSDSRIRLGRPTMEATLREYGIPQPAT
ncbi:MAG: OFA family MFS transporter [Gammaproteobacteria bacterium]|nr:OFA family MFS transporter [Gammaproteobacteria bacterium]MXZ28614.1 OFA family MFS transporter [Gammaproteobacteria bacterium]MYF59201.1 OFA family MFS transporter [Gammaproteobacteria bacterium]